MDAAGPLTQVHYRGKRAVLAFRATVLRVVAGPDDGASCELGLRRITVGTDRANDLVLHDKAVSRRHLEFQVQDDSYLVRDLDSTNGTFYRGAGVREVRVGPGAELRLGGTVLRLERGRETAEAVDSRASFGSLIGAAPVMQDLFGLLAAVAPTDSTVLIQGETGTGKELVAEELHRQSPRRDRPLVVVDCGSIAEGLIESELFGHRKGAFTGALTDRVGAFERADGGTLFLDEIGELPLTLQTRLLRALDKRTVRRVGDDHTREVDVRVIAATNRELQQLVRDGRFRDDLYYRLSVIRVQLPALRERREDIPSLARHFLWQVGCADPAAVLTDEVLEVLSTRSWRGNVRELRNVVERAALLTDGVDALEPSTVREVRDRPEDARLAQRAEACGSGVALSQSLLARSYKEAKAQLLAHFEQAYFERQLELNGDNIQRIADASGVDRQLVRRLLRRHRLGRYG